MGDGLWRWGRRRGGRGLPGPTPRRQRGARRLRLRSPESVAAVNVLVACARVGRVPSALGLVALALLAAGCERPRTEIVVSVDSELPWGDGQMVQSVVLTVRRGGHTGPLRSVRATALGVGRERLPLSVGVIAADDDTDTPVWIEALGCSGPNGCTTDDARVAQRALVRFVRGQTMELPLLLAAACTRASCAGDQRCAPTTGQCEAATRAQEEVRPFNGIDASVGTDVAVHVDGVVVGDDVGAIDAGADVATIVDASFVDVGATDTGLVDAERADVGPVGGDVRDVGVVDTGEAGASVTCGSGLTITTCAGRYACCVNVSIPTDGGSIPFASLCGCQVRAGPTVLSCAPSGIASCD